MRIKVYENRNISDLKIFVYKFFLEMKIFKYDIVLGPPSNFFLTSAYFVKGKT